MRFPHFILPKCICLCIAFHSWAPRSGNAVRSAGVNPNEFLREVDAVRGVGVTVYLGWVAWRPGERRSTQ